MIYYNFRRGLSQQQCIDQLISTCDDEVPSITIVYDWFSKFRRSFTDEFKESHQKSIVVPKIIDTVSELILQNHHIPWTSCASIRKIYKNI